MRVHQFSPAASRISWRALLIAGGAAMLTSPALAQESTTAQPPADPLAQAQTPKPSLPAPQTAQEVVTGQEDAGDGEITVTGYRRSIATALEAKRADVRVTDGISSEDIGKFPSENITEAVQRISGVQMSNVNGRGATISIRGLGPQYANTTINGQTFQSADFTDGFRYDVVQTDLASSIQVIKSPTANMDAGGLSGTVNIDTLKPLEYRGDHIILSVKGQKAENADGGITPKVSATYVNKYLDNTLGVFLNASYQKLKDRADYLWMDRWFTTATTAGTVYTPRRLRYRRIDRETNRLLLNAGLQYQPTETLELAASAIYARDHTTYDVNQQVFGFDRTRQTITKTQGLTNSAITADNVYTDNNRQAEKRNLSSAAYTATAKWNSEGWHAQLVGHYTKGDSLQREDAAIYSVYMNGLSLDYSDPDDVKFSVTTPLTDTNQYATNRLLRATYPNGATRLADAAERATQFDLTRDLDGAFLKSVTIGAKYRHESFDRHVSRHDRDASGAVPFTAFPTIASANYLVTDFLNGRMSIPNSWVAPSLAANEQALKDQNVTVPDLFAPESSYQVDRFIPSVYAMTNIDTTLFGMGVRGNIGARYERTKQKIAGYLTRDVPGAEVDAVAGTYVTRKDYGNFLPSAALILDVTDGVLVRAAAAKVLVRPLLNSNTPLAQVRSTTRDSQNRVFNNIDLGQANLSPLTAKQYDLGVEYYYGQGNALSLNGFWKDIRNGTFSRLICPSTFEGASLAIDGDGECRASNGEYYDITETLNDSSTVTIKGFEAAWTQSLDNLLPVDGFGFTGNYTRVIPEKVANGQGYRVRNLSRQTWNFTGYWEDDTFSIRASVNRRSSYEQDFSDSFFAREGHTVRGRTQVDLALGYAVNEHLNFAAGIINLNDASEEAYKDFTDRWQMSSVTGRNYYLSATARF